MSSLFTWKFIIVGIYKWYITLDSQDGKRGHCLMGVATAGVNLDSFLGQNNESWALSTNKELFSGGKKLRSDFGHKLSRTGLFSTKLFLYLFIIYFLTLCCIVQFSFHCILLHIHLFVFCII